MTFAAVHYKLVLRELSVLVFHFIEVTTWNRVLPEKLTGPQLVKKFPATYVTRRFITAFTRACPLSLF